MRVLSPICNTGHSVDLDLPNPCLLQPTLFDIVSNAPYWSLGEWAEGRGVLLCNHGPDARLICQGLNHLRRSSSVPWHQASHMTGALPRTTALTGTPSCLTSPRVNVPCKYNPVASLLTRFSGEFCLINGMKWWYSRCRHYLQISSSSTSKVILNSHII